jgi:hypothetical protein
MMGNKKIFHKLSNLFLTTKTYWLNYKCCSMQFNNTKYFGILLCCLAAYNIQARDNKLTPAQQQMLDQKNANFSFVENKGQITDEHNELRGDIQYNLKTPGVNIFLGDAQLHYQFTRTNADDKNNIDAYRMDVVLVGADKNAMVVADEEQAYTEMYGSANQTITAHSFERVTYKNVYPNIDWVLYIKNGSLEYDFLVNPGGNAKDIKIKYKGNTELSIANNGGAIVKTPFGTVSEGKPFSYVAASGKEISSSFSLKDGIVSFNTVGCKSAYVIDPQLTWATYYGGPGNGDVGITLVTDQSNNIYMAGNTNSATNIATAGAYQTSLAGNRNAFVVKFNSAGTRQFATYFGGNGSDNAEQVAIDNNGNIYLCGFTTSSTGLFTTGGAQNTNGGGTDGFLVKFNNSGTPQWGTYFGGPSTDQPYSVTCDAFGSVYMSGSTSSANLATAGAYQTSITGGTDGFIAKYNTAGVLRYVTYYGGNGTDVLTNITTDLAGNVFATGYTNSNSSIASAGSYQASFGGFFDGLLVKFDSTVHARMWGTYYGGTSLDAAASVAIDISGNAIITGYTYSNTGIATTGSAQSTNGGGQDGFLAKFNTNGSIVWSTYIGGTGSEQPSIVVPDKTTGTILVTGNTTSTANIATTGSGVYQNTLSGSSDAFYQRYDSLGRKLYGTYYGGTGAEVGNCIAVDNTGAVYICGSTASPTNIATTGAYQTTISVPTDAFLAKFNLDTFVLVAQPYTDTIACPGGSFNLTYNASFAFNTGNTFTAQLSNAFGSFAAPTTIGTVTANTTTGTIPVTIPGGTATGTGYRIRIVATNPAYTSPDDYVNINIISSISSPTITSNSPVCVGDSIKLIAANTSTIAPSTLTISGPNGFTSSSPISYVPFATSANAGTYIASVAHNGCPATTASVNVAVNSTIPATPTATSNTPICSGTALNINASSSMSPVTYRITGPHGFVATSQNAVIPNADTSRAGYYYITDTLNGCRSAKDSILITVNQSVITTLHVTAVPGDSICAGSAVSFIATAGNAGNNPQYQWRLKNAVLGDTAVVGAISNIYASGNLLSGDIVYCILYSNAQCLVNPNDTSNMVKITVLQPYTPIVYISANPGSLIAQGTAVTFISTVVHGGSNTSYQWYINGHAIANDTLNNVTFHSLADSDVVTLIVHNHVMCAAPDSAVSNAIRIRVNNVGVNNIQEALGTLNLYPNPTSGNLLLNGIMPGLTSKTIQLEIWNAVGQLVYTSNEVVTNGTINMPLQLGTNVVDGIYLLRVKADGNSRVIRFTVQR